MLPFIGIVGGFAGFFKLATDVAKWAGLRLLLAGLITTVLPIVLYNFWLRTISFVMDKQMTALESANVDLSEGLHLTGLMAWMAAHMKIPEAVGIIVSALTIRFMISFFKR